MPSERIASAIAEPVQDTPELFRVTVRAVHDVRPFVRRLTLASERLVTYQPSGPDEYFGLLMPRERDHIALPDPRSDNIRSAIAQMADEVRPTLRWYTVREHRRGVGEVDVDVVTHGDDGPGSAWVTRARSGDIAAYRVGGSCYTAPTSGTQLLVADATSVPALAVILDGLTPSAQVRAYVEVPDDAHCPPLHTSHDITYLRRGAAAPGSAVHRVIAESDASDMADVSYAWLCGEAGMVTRLRRHLVRERGMAKEAVFFSGYWRLGEARI